MGYESLLADAVNRKFVYRVLLSEDDIAATFYPIINIK